MDNTDIFDQAFGPLIEEEEEEMTIGLGLLASWSGPTHQSAGLQLRIKGKITL
jgi:hypothetical protein